MISISLRLPKIFLSIKIYSAYMPVEIFGAGLSLAPIYKNDYDNVQNLNAENSAFPVE